MYYIVIYNSACFTYKIESNTNLIACFNWKWLQKTIYGLSKINWLSSAIEFSMMNKFVNNCDNIGMEDVEIVNHVCDLFYIHAMYLFVSVL